MEQKDVQEVHTYLKHRREEHLEQLRQLLRIPSVSSDSSRKHEVMRAAEWLAEALRQAGLDNVRLLETSGNPIVYGDWLHAPGKPTALIYGHYDVQPEDPLELWDTPPFEPTIRDGKLYARGATDDKAQLFLHIKTIEAYLQTIGELPINVKFCLEGEEEIASPSLPSFLETHSDMLSTDMIVISDGPMYDEETPSICVGLRGLCGFEIEVSGPKSDLHSGLYGGAVANPITALAGLLASMRNADGSVAVAGFYDHVDPIPEAVRSAYRNLPIDESRIKQQLGVSSLFGEQGYSYLERTTARPTLEINGIQGGFQGEGTKTIIPSSARAKLTCRLVDRQDPEHIMDVIETHVRSHTPPGVEVKMTRMDRGKPFVISPDHPYIQTAAKAYASGFGKRPVFIRSGGSIPIVEAFNRVLQAPVIMMDFGLPGENMHAPNEHFHLTQWDKGGATLIHYWHELGG